MAVAGSEIALPVVPTSGSLVGLVHPQASRLWVRRPAAKEQTVAHLFQVGAGSGGMPVLDMVCRDSRVTRVTLVEPDVYKEHNVVRHLFPPSAVGRLKAELARDWLIERRPDLDVRVL